MIPYYHDDLAGITIYQGDCLQVMPLLPEKSIDAIITDIPYGTTACSWDQVIPFVDMWREVKRLIKPRGAVVLFGSQPFFSFLVASNVKWFKWEDIWEKSRPVGFLNAEDRPLRAHENIAVFCDGQPIYNPQKWAIDPRFMDRRKTFTINIDDSPVYGKRKPKAHNMDDGTRYPISIIPINTEGGIHTTQKPLDLMQYLIRTYTNPGDTVLDFTMGSGTTLEAAKLEGRKAIGIERDTGKNGECLGYCDYAVQRLSQGVLQLF